jgi:hypothetical protein
MKRSFLFQTAWLTMVILWGGGVRGEDAPIQREDIGRALEMYRWLVNHEEFSAAGKLAAELQAIHPDDPQVQLIVENAQLRAAVREANRVLVEDEQVSAADTAPPPQWEMIPPWETLAGSPPDPFEPDINWRELGSIKGSSPIAESEILQTSGVVSEEPPPRLLFDTLESWNELRQLRETTGVEELSSEARIWMALTKSISMHFNEIPLSDVARYISESCNINVVIDERGLEEEGVTRDTPVTIVEDGIQARSALRQVLGPLHLDYTIEDEVVHITSRTRKLGGLTTRVYAVPDLVTPIPHRVPGSARDSLERLSDTSTAGFETLIDQITRTVDPDSWSDVGGQGIVTTHEGTLSLVIRQTQPAHEEISDLLSQVRRLRDVQVSHTLHLLSVPVSQLHELGLSHGTVHILSAEERSDHEMKFLGEESRFDVQTLPGITLFSGQTGTVADSERTMLISSVASANRRSVRVNVAAPQTLEAGDVMAAVQSAEVPDGGVGLILMSDAEQLLNDRDRVEVLAVTPRILVQEEEEELLGLPVH